VNAGLVPRAWSFSSTTAFGGSSEQILFVVLYCIIYACIIVIDIIDVVIVVVVDVTIVIILLLSEAGSPVSRLLGLYARGNRDSITSLLFFTFKGIKKMIFSLNK